MYRLIVRKLVECETDGLGGSTIQMQLGREA
jgi:hypothetical protein